MVEEGIRGGICHSIHRHAKANNKYMENYDENKESSYIQYLVTNNLYGWAMSQKLPVNGFKWVEDTSRINEEFIKNYNKNNNKGYILEVENIKYKMLNLDNIVSNKNENKDNNWPFRMLIIGPSGSGKTNTLLHLINNLHPIDKIYLYAKDLSEPK